MKQLINHMRLQAQLAQGRAAVTRAGIVTSYNPATYAVKVRIQPEDVETGWLPLGSAWVGNGWGLFTPPSAGDMVHVEFIEGDNDSGIVCNRLFSDGDRPLSVPSGELWMVHRSGSVLKFKNDGTVEISAQTELKYSAPLHTFHGPVVMDETLSVVSTIEGTGGLAITGVPAGGTVSASIAGDLTVTGGDIKADDISVKGHHHPNGTPNTGSAIP